MDRKEHRGAFLRQKRKMQLTKKTKPATIKKLTPASGPQGATRGFLTKEKTYLLIDGENFVHRIEESLKTRNIIKNRAQLKKIDYDILFDFAEKATKRYYSTILRMPKKDHPLYKKAQKIRQWQFAWVPYLISKNIQYIKSGYLRTREGKVCPKCGGREVKYRKLVE